MPLCWPRFIASVSFPRTTQFHIPPTAVVSFLFFIALFLSFPFIYYFWLFSWCAKIQLKLKFFNGQAPVVVVLVFIHHLILVFFPLLLSLFPFFIIRFILLERGGRKKKEKLQKKKEAEKNPQKKGRKSSVAKQGGTGWYSKLLCTVYTVNYV